VESVNVKVIFTGPAEQLVGCPQELIALPEGSTLRELLHLLSERHGSDFRDYVFVDGETLSDEILILIDGLNALGRHLWSVIPALKWRWGFWVQFP